LTELISIIIPCYNAEDTISRAINSALSQTYSNIEIIVIDDGSTDNSLEVIKGFGEEIFWQNVTNRGGGSARNIGIGVANGDFVQFLDADDELFPECVSKKMDFIRELPDFIPVCDSEDVSFDGQSRITQKHISGKEVSIEEVICTLMQFNPNIDHPLHRRPDLIEIDGFDEKLNAGQEYDLHLRLVFNGIRFRRLPEVLVKHHEVAGSISGQGLEVVKIYGGIFRSVGSWALDRSSTNLRKQMAYMITHNLLKRIGLGWRGNDLNSDLELAKRLDPVEWRVAYHKRSTLHYIISYTSDPILFEFKLRGIKKKLLGAMSF